MSLFLRKSVTFVYRRVASGQRAKAPALVKPQLFELRPDETGLSVFADTVTPRAALQAMIDVQYGRAAQGDTSAQDWLTKNPDVETLVEAKGWGVLQIPVAAFLERGFTLSEVEENGHLNILGNAEQFTNARFDFVELVVDGLIVVLSDEECLRKETAEE